MYTLIGDFVRMGPFVDAPKHSVMVTERGNKDYVVSLNRSGRKVMVHFWHVTGPTAHGVGLEPLRSEHLNTLFSEFMRVEKQGSI